MHMAVGEFPSMLDVYLLLVILYPVHMHACDSGVFSRQDVYLFTGKSVSTVQTQVITVHTTQGSHEILSAHVHKPTRPPPQAALQ